MFVTNDSEFSPGQTASVILYLFQRFVTTYVIVFIFDQYAHREII